MAALALQVLRAEAPQLTLAGWPDGARSRATLIAAATRAALGLLGPVPPSAITTSTRPGSLYWRKLVTLASEADRPV